ncbi:hypothetical protein Tco_0679177 [Tanacetum coccineum]|uniref:Reverse transcriptase domain-containing protein n=1 Tax=Tanacetum coccineum TaxID=301880 RepID=A0ABQ4XI30_9ASTR
MALTEKTRDSRRYSGPHHGPRDAKIPVYGGMSPSYNTRPAPPKECNTLPSDVTQTKRQHATKVTNLKVAIHPDYPEQEVSIGGSLSDRGRAAVCALLQRNLDIFAWEPKHMTGVPRSITKHRLKISDSIPQYHAISPITNWLSNPVMVKKSDVAGVSPNPNAKDDEEKTAFHKGQVSIAIQNLPLVGLKKCWCQPYRATETFRALRQVNMKLNPKKCTFGATEGMFLGYLIGTDGIKPCPDKTKAVIQLPSPRTECKKSSR